MKYRITVTANRFLSLSVYTLACLIILYRTNIGLDQTFGDLTLYRYFYDHASNSYSLVQYLSYMQSNAILEPVLPTLYFLLDHIGLTFSTYLFATNLLLGILVIRLSFISSYSKLSIKYLLIAAYPLFMICSLYFYGLITNADRTKLALIFFLLPLLFRKRLSLPSIILFQALSIVTHFSSALFFLSYLPRLFGKLFSFLRTPTLRLDRLTLLLLLTAIVVLPFTVDSLAPILVGISGKLRIYASNANSKMILISVLVFIALGFLLITFPKLIKDPFLWTIPFTTLPTLLFQNNRVLLLLYLTISLMLNLQSFFLYRLSKKFATLVYIPLYLYTFYSIILSFRYESKILDYGFGYSS